MRKRVKAILPALLGLLFVGFTYSQGAVEQRTGADTIAIDALVPFGELERSIVQFPHGQHTAAMPELDCLSCHDQGSDGKTGESAGVIFRFKGQPLNDKEALKDLYHNECIGCHAEREKAKKPSGPQTCNTCHVNDVAAPTPPKRVRFGLELHGAHADKASLECNSCHHVYSPTEKKAVYVKGEEGSCVYCHQETMPASVPEGMPSTTLKSASHDQCLNCHLKIEKAQQAQHESVKTGPLLCNGCHNPPPAKAMSPVPETMRLKRNQPDIVVIGAKNAGDTPDKMRVPFNHKSHELSDISCQTCHHKALIACTECHTTMGSEKGGKVTLEKAMHTQRSDRSCIACHNEAKESPECAGCHQTMVTTSIPTDKSCTVCHSLKAEEGIALPQGEALQKMMANRPKPTSSSLRKKSPETVVIDDLALGYKPAIFPHRKMVDALADGIGDSAMASVFHGSDEALCLGCHHNAPATAKPAQCASCHGKERTAKEDSRPDLMGAFHIQCMECHDTMKVDLSGDCTACHAALTTPASKK